MPNVYIRKVPRLLVWLKIIPDTVCFALAPYIFLSEAFHKDYLTDKSTYRTKAILAHELVHFHHQQAVGLLKFLFLYFFSDEYCLNEEIAAIKKEMEVYVDHGATFDTKDRARSLSSFWMYHHCVTHNDAKKLLDNLWSDHSRKTDWDREMEHTLLQDLARIGLFSDVFNQWISAKHANLKCLKLLSEIQTYEDRLRESAITKRYTGFIVQNSDPIKVEKYNQLVCLFNNELAVIKRDNNYLRAHEIAEQAFGLMAQNSTE